MLLQDDINAAGTVMWRMHTNATVTIDSGGTSATLALDGQKMEMTILNPPSGATFTMGDGVRLTGDPALPSGQTDQANPGVTVLMISLPGSARCRHNSICNILVIVMLIGLVYINFQSILSQQI